MHLWLGILVAATLAGSAPAARAETPQEWVTLLTRVHGGFGSFLPVGIRIGEDAMKRLNAKPRELAVTFYQGDKVPCPCPLDGIMLAIGSSPGPAGGGGEIAARYLRRRNHQAAQGRRRAEIYRADLISAEARRDQPHHRRSDCALRRSDGDPRPLRRRTGAVARRSRGDGGAGNHSRTTRQITLA